MDKHVWWIQFNNSKRANNILPFRKGVFKPKQRVSVEFIITALSKGLSRRANTDPGAVLLAKKQTKAGLGRDEKTTEGNCAQSGELWAKRRFCWLDALYVFDWLSRFLPLWFASCARTRLCTFAPLCSTKQTTTLWSDSMNLDLFVTSGIYSTVQWFILTNLIKTIYK